MADHAPEYLLLDHPPSASMLGTSSRPGTVAIKRSTDDDEGPVKRPRNDSQTITTQGISGNARVLNVGGDHITHTNDGLSADAYALFESIEMRLKVVQDKELDTEVHVWLSAPDVSQNLNAALRRRQVGTGAWFLDSPTFAQWKEKPNDVLCIYGAPGCGKTVLCSTIIEAVRDSCTTPLSGWAYFFFDRRNANKGLLLYENFLRSVLSQLCSRCGGIPKFVEAMYQSHGSGREQPSVRALEETLRAVTAAFDDVYIVVDSLDECDDTDKSELLNWIETLAEWNLARWHLLVTSQPKPDITSRLELICNIFIIRLRGAVLHKDISDYLDKRLSLISHWTEAIRALVKTTLLGGADEMFRWVAMQMDNLANCMNTKEVKETLKTLPKDLEETYEQILARSSRPKELLRMLHWLAFSARELLLEEIAEVPSVDFDAEDGPCYDPDLKYSNPSIALTVCSGLVTETDGIVKLAHFSVKEYLISVSIKTGMAAQFAMSERLAHSVIAQTCVAYLMIFNTPDSIQIPVTATGPFPLHLYAAEYISSHLSFAHATNCPALQSLLLKLFTPAHPFDYALINWCRMYDPDTPRRTVDVKLQKSAEEVAPPLYYASTLGLKGVVEHLLESGNTVDRSGGYHKTPLLAAAYKGHTEIAAMLLERGADSNLSIALSVAAAQGHTETALMLLEHGADVHFRGGDYWTALQVAASKGSTETVKLLLEHGAEVNLQGGYYKTALQAAASKGSLETVKLLLAHGADVNLQGGYYRTALQAAASQGSIETTRLLLENDADVNLQGGYYWTALQAAVLSGFFETAKLLLEYGANVNLEGGKVRPALQAAAWQGSVETVRLLLKHGADINFQGGGFETALYAAAMWGHAECCKMLLEHGANVNLEGGKLGPALQAAARRGSIETVRMLLDHGADVNIQGGDFRTALYVAVMWGNTPCCKILLEHGADANIQAGDFETALQAATRLGHRKIRKLLLQYDTAMELGLPARATSPPKVAYRVQRSRALTW